MLGKQCVGKNDRSCNRCRSGATGGDALTRPRRRDSTKRRGGVLKEPWLSHHIRDNKRKKRFVSKHDCACVFTLPPAGCSLFRGLAEECSRTRNTQFMMISPPASIALLLAAPHELPLITVTSIAREEPNPLPPPPPPSPLPPLSLPSPPSDGSVSKGYRAGLCLPRLRRAGRLRRCRRRRRQFRDLRFSFFMAQDGTKVKGRGGRAGAGGGGGACARAAKNDRNRMDRNVLRFTRDFIRQAFVRAPAREYPTRTDGHT